MREVDTPVIGGPGPQQADRPPYLHPTDAAMRALEHTQRAAESAEWATRRMEEHLEQLQEPARMVTIALDAVTPIQLDRWRGEQPCRSVGVLNPTSVVTYLGVGGATPRAGNRAVPVAANSLLVLPIWSKDLEVGVDPTTLAGQTAVVFVLRWTTVQPAFFGAA